MFYSLRQRISFLKHNEMSIINLKKNLNQEITLCKGQLKIYTDLIQKDWTIALSKQEQIAEYSQRIEKSQETLYEIIREDFSGKSEYRYVFSLLKIAICRLLAATVERSTVDYSIVSFRVKRKVYFERIKILSESITILHDDRWIVQFIRAAQY